MRTYLAATDITLVIPLRLNGEPFIPDTGTVKYTLRDGAGAVMAGFEDITVSMGVADTEAVIVVAAAQNALGSGRFAKRTLVVKASKATRPVTFQETYRLTSWLNTTVSPQDIRNFIGIGPGELPDDAIDIVTAYFDVEDEVTEAILTEKLAGADADERSANNAILAKSVLNLIPSLQLRITQSESNGVFQATRPKINIAELEMRAQALYSDAVDAFASRLEITGDILVTAVLSPDPITGA